MKTQRKYMGLYTFTYMAIGVLTPLIGQYLKSIHFSGTEIGTITATGTCVAVFASTFWGNIYGKIDKKHLLVLLVCCLAATVAMVISHIYIYPIFIVLFGLMYFFQAPVMSLSDALLIYDNQPFGFIRTFGAVGFALGVFIAARIADAFGLQLIFPMYCSSYIIAAIIIYLIYRTHKYKEKANNASINKKKNKEDIGYKALFKNKKYVQLLICAFFLCGTNVANNTYFSFLYIEGGGALAGVGIAFLLMAGSEAPVMAWTEYLTKKISAEKLILFAMIVSVLRFAWYGTGPSNILLLALFALQGIVNGIILVEFVKYVARLVKESMSGLAIATYYSISSSGSTICCQMIGGLVLDHFGPQGVYIFFSLFNLAGVLLYLLFGLHRGTKNIN